MQPVKRVYSRVRWYHDQDVILQWCYRCSHPSNSNLKSLEITYWKLYDSENSQLGQLLGQVSHVGGSRILLEHVQPPPPWPTPLIQNLTILSKTKPRYKWCYDIVFGVGSSEHYHRQHELDVHHCGIHIQLPAILFAYVQSCICGMWYLW